MDVVRGIVPMTVLIVSCYPVMKMMAPNSTSKYMIKLHTVLKLSSFSEEGS